MKIEDLIATGGIVSVEPVEKTIEWYSVDKDGELVPEKYKVHVLKLSFQKIEEIARSSKSSTTAFIAEGILFDNGQTKLTPDQASLLSAELVERLIEVFNEVNSAPGKSISARKKSSGTK